MFVPSLSWQKCRFPKGVFRTASAPPLPLSDCCRCCSVMGCESFEKAGIGACSMSDAEPCAAEVCEGEAAEPRRLSPLPLRCISALMLSSSAATARCFIFWSLYTCFHNINITIIPAFSPTAAAEPGSLQA